MFNYLGGVKNDKRTDDPDAAFKQDLSNFHIAIVVDMRIIGFDVMSLTYMVICRSTALKFSEKLWNRLKILRRMVDYKRSFLFENMTGRKAIKNSI